MPVAPHRPADLRGRVFRGSAVLADGRLTRGQLRSSAWRRLFRDVYACESLEVTHRLRAVAASRLLLPGAVVSGRSAAVLWGVDAAGPAEDVELTVEPGAAVTTVPGVRIRRWPLGPPQVDRRGRTRLTVPETTAVDIGRERRDLVESVVVVDALVERGRTDLAAVRRAAAAATGPGCRRARQVADLADGLAGSPQETRVRLLIRGSRLPLPVAQFTVLDGHGRFAARVDFAWPEQRLALEYDGIWHGDPHQVGKDRARLNRLTACGWRVLFVTAADLRDPGRLLARIAAELAR